MAEKGGGKTFGVFRPSPLASDSTIWTHVETICVFFRCPQAAFSLLLNIQEPLRKPATTLVNPTRCSGTSALQADVPCTMIFCLSCIFAETKIAAIATMVSLIAGRNREARDRLESSLRSPDFS